MVSLGSLTACGTSSPPADELAHEMIDAANGPDDQPLSESERECMHDQVDDFELTEAEQEGFGDLDEVFDKAADGQAAAMEIVARFQAELTTCRGVG